MILINAKKQTRYQDIVLTTVNKNLYGRLIMSNTTLTDTSNQSSSSSFSPSTQRLTKNNKSLLESKVESDNEQKPLYLVQTESPDPSSSSNNSGNNSDEEQHQEHTSNKQRESQNDTTSPNIINLEKSNSVLAITPEAEAEHSLTADETDQQTDDEKELHTVTPSSTPRLSRTNSSIKPQFQTPTPMKATAQHTTILKPYNSSLAFSPLPKFDLLTTPPSSQSFTRASFKQAPYETQEDNSIRISSENFPQTPACSQNSNSSICSIDTEPEPYEDQEPQSARCPSTLLHQEEKNKLGADSDNYGDAVTQTTRKLMGDKASDVTNNANKSPKIKPKANFTLSSPSPCFLPSTPTNNRTAQTIISNSSSGNSTTTTTYNYEDMSCDVTEITTPSSTVNGTPQTYTNHGIIEASTPTNRSHTTKKKRGQGILKKRPYEHFDIKAKPEKPKKVQFDDQFLLASRVFTQEEEEDADYADDEEDGSSSFTNTYDSEDDEEDDPDYQDCDEDEDDEDRSLYSEDYDDEDEPYSSDDIATINKARNETIHECSLPPLQSYGHISRAIERNETRNKILEYLCQIRQNDTVRKLDEFREFAANAAEYIYNLKYNQNEPCIEDAEHQGDDLTTTSLATISNYEEEEEEEDNGHNIHDASSSLHKFSANRQASTSAYPPISAFKINRKQSIINETKSDKDAADEEDSTKKLSNGNTMTTRPSSTQVISYKHKLVKLLKAASPRSLVHQQERQQKDGYSIINEFLMIELNLLGDQDEDKKETEQSLLMSLGTDDEDLLSPSKDFAGSTPKSKPLAFNSNTLNLLQQSQSAGRKRLRSADKLYYNTHHDSKPNFTFPPNNNNDEESDSFEEKINNTTTTTNDGNSENYASTFKFPLSSSTRPKSLFLFNDKEANDNNVNPLTTQQLNSPLQKRRRRKQQLLNNNNNNNSSQTNSIVTVAETEPTHAIKKRCLAVTKK